MNDIRDTIIDLLDEMNTFEALTGELAHMRISMRKSRHNRDCLANKGEPQRALPKTHIPKYERRLAKVKAHARISYLKRIQELKAKVHEIGYE